MKRNIPLLLVLAATVFFGCSKESSNVGSTPAPQSGSTVTSGPGFNRHSVSRTAGASYSQPISIELANQMIGSYLTSQGYPSADTSIRSLSINADTLRAYLQNPSIKTIKLMFAHQPDYTSGSYGKDARMNPKVITTVLVGTDAQNNFVRNSSNGVYEHFDPCPIFCDDLSPYIY